MSLVDNTPKLERAVVEVFGGCNYSCKMCPQSTGRGAAFTRKMPFKLFEETLDQLVELGSPMVQLEGSGEPTMAQDLDRYVQACTDRGLRSYMFTNGERMQGEFMERVIDAGLSFVRFSVIGYNQDLYKKWMSLDRFEVVLKNIQDTNRYIKHSGSECQVSTYHLIMNDEQEYYETIRYRGIVEWLGVTGYVWKQHNWSGNLDAPYERQGKRKTCGRPFANEITIRAGGNDGHRGAVTPCCQTMGPPNEAESVLGHLDEKSIVEVWNDQPYQELRKAHAEERFDDISYCSGCDFLIDDPEVLVWTNDPDYKVKGMLGTEIDLNKGLTS